MDSSNIVLLAVLVALSALFSGSEVAFVSVSPAKVKELVKKKKYGAIFLEKLKSNPHRLLSAILTGSNIVNIAAAAIATQMATEYYGSSGVGIATGVMTVILLVFGEVIPKSIAIEYAPRLACAFAAPVYILSILLTPIVWVLEQISRGVHVFFGGKLKQRMVSEDELKAMVDISAEEGSIEKQEREFIENVFKLNDMTAEDVMTPRIDVDVLDVDTTVSETLDFLLTHQHSRIPIYHGSVDKIVGLLYVRTLLPQLKDPNFASRKLSDLDFQKPIKVPLTKKLNSMFQQFQKTHIHMAIVVDEHGGFAGIVTLEDIIEEIVGEIEDEHDTDVPMIERIGLHTIIAQGKTELEDIEKIFKVEITDADKHDAISWYILEKLNRFPRQGEEIKVGKLLVTIEEMHENKIEKVRITKIPRKQAGEQK